MSQARLPLREGQSVPDVTFRLRRNGEWATVTSADIFAGKNVVVFSLPGAFTPTCSSTHLPRFNELAPVFAEQGIDSIVCISVNDPFVMSAWGQRDGSEDITMIADGNGAFADATGLAFDGSQFGMGKRSQRYSMLVNDGVVEQLNLEQPGEYRASSAEYMLDQLATA